MSNPANAAVLESSVAIAAARENCIGISDELNKMKTMAGVGTALGGVGVATSGGALASGIVKSSKDASAEQLNIQIEDLKKQRDAVANDSVNLSLTPELRAYRTEFIDFYVSRIRSEIDAMIAELGAQHAELDKQSKTLGNVRTGLMAGTTALNIGGAVVAGTNKVDVDLESRIKLCIKSIENVRDSRMQAYINGEDVSKMDEIIAACDAYSTLDLTKINKRASGAQWASVVGVATGAAGLVTSAVANTSSVRDTNMADGSDTAKEKNLNVASNVLSGGAAVASGVATGFNAAQIKVIKRASEIADKCEKALQ